MPPARVPLVEIGSVAERVRVGAVPAGEAFGEGDGEGEGEGETTGDGEGSVTTGCDAISGVTVFELCVAAEVSGACRLKP